MVKLSLIAGFWAGDPIRMYERRVTIDPAAVSMVMENVDTGGQQIPTPPGVTIWCGGVSIWVLGEYDRILGMIEDAAG